MVIGPDTVFVLKRWRAAFRERAIAAGIAPAAVPSVFTSDLAGALPWRSDRGTKRFAPLRDAAGIDPRVRLQDLRHFVGAEFLAAGVPVNPLSGRHGYTRSQSTAGIYASVIPADDHASAALLRLRLAGG